MRHSARRVLTSASHSYHLSFHSIGDLQGRDFAETIEVLTSLGDRVSVAFSAYCGYKVIFGPDQSVILPSFPFSPIK